MNTDELVKLEQRYSLPPGMSLHISQNERFNELCVSYLFKTTDSYHPDKPTEITSSLIIRADTYPEVIDAQVRLGAISLWSHEFDEWFKVDGKLVRDPHNRGELDLGLLQGKHNILGLLDNLDEED